MANNNKAAQFSILIGINNVSTYPTLTNSAKDIIQSGITISASVIATTFIKALVLLSFPINWRIG